MIAPRNDEGRIRVGVFAQLLEGSAGGIESNLLGLLSGLAEHPEAARQVVIGPGGESGWLQRHLGSNQEVMAWPPIRNTRRGPRRSGLTPWTGGLRGAVRGAARWTGQWLRGARTADAFEVAGQHVTRVLAERGVQLVHFPYQRYFPTTLPFLFEPWDMQHRHLPEFFTEDEIAFRNELYGRAAHEAALVVAASVWSARDFVAQLGVSAGRVAVIERGVSRAFSEGLSEAEVESLLAELRLPAAFAIYPAKTWPHKNHLGLVRALHALRRAGVRLPLVCSGKPVEPGWSALRREIEALGLADQVHFVGHVANRQLAALYRRARLMVFPSLFEGLGIPLLEAMHCGVPVLCSDVTCLPEVAGGAAVYFDPRSTEQLADALVRVWRDAELRMHLVATGRERALRFRWSAVGGKFLLCYRKLAGVSLSGEEQASYERLALGAAG
jgi:glycosyltransferase involved in cell wall biosynthesis